MGGLTVVGQNMARERDWIDYANLGSNIFQNFQLNDVQNKLGAVASVAVAEQRVAGAENNRREIVFEANTVLRGMRTLAEENKAGVLALARESLLNFKRYGISSANFRAYEDKERVRSLIDGYEALVDECSAGLPAPQREEAESCGKYLAEQDDLKLAVELQEKREALDRARSELRLWEQKSRLQSILGWVGGLLSLAGVVWVFVSCSEWIDDPKTSQVSQMAAGPGLGCLIVGIVLFAGAVNSKNLKQTEIQRAKVKELGADAALLEPPIGILPDLLKQFGSNSASELRAKRAEREALIAKVLKKKSEPASATVEPPSTLPKLDKRTDKIPQLPTVTDSIGAAIEIVKKCEYCGKEYSQEATVCEVDRHPLISKQRAL